MAVKEFIVNKCITLRLEDEKTNIYVMGELFRQCKYLILNIPVDKMEDLEDIESIEDAIKKLKSTEGSSRVDIEYDISPEEEFFAHCSNLQAWAENGYDSRILHYNLSFSLLEKIAEYDLTAKIILKEEIAKRLKGRNKNVVKYIQEKNLDTYLPYNLLLEDIVHPEDLEILREIEVTLNKRFYYYDHRETGLFIHPKSDYELSDNFFDVDDKNKRITFLKFQSPDINSIPDAVSKFTHLESIGFADFNNIIYLPKLSDEVETWDERSDKKKG